MALKITLLGAGSVVFAKTLLSDVLQSPALSDATIALMDIDPARLHVAQIMAERIVAKLGVRARIEATLDQREAIRDANYVIATVQVGGYKPGTVIDFEIPRRYGLLQTIGDTLGIGGVFRGLRTIPVLTAFARDIAEVGAPNCLLLNYSNPMAMNCWAVDRAVGIPHVGLCHSVQGTSHLLADLVRLPMKDVSYLVAGINHMAFFLRFEYRRQDAYPLLFALLEDSGFQQEKVRFEMMRRTGYFVTESSEHQSEYVPYFIHHGEEVISRFDVPIDEYLRRCESIIKTWKATEAKLLGGEEGITVEPPSHEYGSYIIHSRETNTPRVVYGNVPNRGLIDNLPAGCCVEVPCLVDATGLQPTHVGLLPPQLAAICQTNINVQALTVEAALTGQREHIYHAAMLDPHTAATLPLDKIWNLCDDLIEAHQKAGLLGEFKPVVRGTGRAFAGTGDRLVAQVEPDPRHSLDETAGELRLQVRVRNPRAQAARVPLVVRTSGDQATVPAEQEFFLSVEAHGEATHPVSLRHSVPAGTATVTNGKPWNLRVDLDSGSPDVLTLGMNILPRPVHDVSGGRTASFEAALAGFPAVRGTIGVQGEDLVVTCQVQDSKITPAPDNRAWAGSCVELLFAPGAGADIRRATFVPTPDQGSPSRGGEVVVCNQVSIEGARADYTLEPTGGYTMHMRIPFAGLGMGDREATLLFNALVTISALGDAHGGGRIALGGSIDTWRSTDYYARIKIAG